MKALPYSTKLNVTDRTATVSFWLVLICIPLIWGLFSVHLGQDIDGDQLYYHYYGASSVLNGRFLHDIAAGGLSGYNNPLMYFPFVFGVDHLSAKSICFLIGAWQGLNIALILAISRQLIRPVSAWGVLLCAIVVAYLLTSPIFIMVIGRTFGDDWVSVPFLAGMWCLLGERQTAPRDCIGALLIGASAGLKITNLPLAAAFGIALAIADPRPKRLLSVAAGMFVGFLATAGWWLRFSYLHFGNPLFPYYNAVFKSPLFPSVDFHDSRWGLPHLRDLFFLPISMAEGTTTVIEATYEDTHWLVFGILVVITVICAGIRLFRTGHLEIGRSTIILGLFCSVAFVAWAILLHYMRYLMVAEMTLPIVMAALLRFLYGSDRLAFLTMAALTAISASADHYLPLRWARINPAGSWYQIPALGVPAGSTVVLGNGIGYVERALPLGTTMIGLGSNFFFAGLPSDGGTPAILNQIENAMWREPDQVYQVELMSLPASFNSAHVDAAFGFTFDPSACRDVVTNLGMLQVCHLAPENRGAAPAKLTPR